MQSFKGKFNCRERLEGLLEIIKSPLSLFAAAKISNAFRWLGHCVFDARKISAKALLQNRLLTGYKVPHEADAVLQASKTSYWLQWAQNKATSSHCCFGKQSPFQAEGIFPWRRILCHVLREPNLKLFPLENFHLK